MASEDEYGRIVSLSNFVSFRSIYFKFSLKFWQNSVLNSSWVFFLETL